MGSKVRRLERARTPEIPKPIAEAFCVHEALRRLGYLSQDIFFQVAGPLRPGLAPTLRRPDGSVESVLLTHATRFQISMALVHGESKFVVTTGFLGGRWTKAKIGKTWREFVRAVSAGDIPEETLLAIWERSEVKTRGLELISGLQARGFNPVSDGAEA